MNNILSLHTLMMASGVIVAALITPVSPGGPASADLVIVQYILDRNGDHRTRAEAITQSENGRVVFLDLSNKDLTTDGIRTLPSALAGLTELRTLLLRDNNLSELPGEFSALTRLTRLDLAGNRFTAIPDVVLSLKELDSLDLRFNSISSLPGGISALKNLRYLQLWGNRLTTLPTSIAACPALGELYLSYNRMVTLPDGIAAMKSLTYVDFQNNRFCSVPPNIDKWLKRHERRYLQEQWCPIR